jgi:sugar phosphate isomerase/epimerase
MALPLSIQLYTVRDLIKEKGYLPVLKSISEAGYSHVELGDFYGNSAGGMKKVLDEIVLKTSAWWAPVLDPQKRNEVVENAAALGTKDLVTGYGPNVFESDAEIKKTAETLNQALDYYVPKGFTISLHNHYWEFHNQRYDNLLQLAPKAHLEVDIYWVQVGGADPVKVIEKYGKRVRMLHIKDGPANKRDSNADMTAVGQGDVKVADCVKAAERAGNVGALTVELDRCATDMMDAVRASYDFMIKNKLATGKK